MTILCTSNLRVRARAGALVLAAVREDVRADANAAADSDVDEPPRAWRQSIPTQRLTMGNEVLRQHVGDECLMRLM